MRKREKCFIDGDKVSISSSKNTLYPRARDTLFYGFLMPISSSGFYYDKISFGSGV